MNKPAFTRNSGGMALVHLVYWNLKKMWSNVNWNQRYMWGSDSNKIS